MAERSRPARLSCTAGEVSDLSSGGVRLECRRALRGDVAFRLEHDDGHAVDLVARTIWCRRTGFRRFVAGLAFIDLTPEAARMIAHLESASDDPAVG